MPIKCVIVSPDKTLYDDLADLVLLPSMNGQIGIMEHHAPLFGELEAGIITVRYKEHEFVFTISSGFVHVEPGMVRVLSEASESIDEIDVERAEEAKARAQEAMKNAPSVESPEFMAAMMRVRRNTVRINAAKRGLARRKGKI